MHEIKANTCKLACRQLEGIHRLKNLRKWKIHRLDATEVFLKRNREDDEAWEKLVARPSTMMVSQFLYSVGATRVATEEMVSNAALLLLCDLVGDSCLVLRRLAFCPSSQSMRETWWRSRWRAATSPCRSPPLLPPPSPWATDGWRHPWSGEASGAIRSRGYVWLHVTLQE